MAEIPEHKDILGRIIKIGDHVAYPDSNRLQLGKIDKLNPKMVRVQRGNWEFNKYPSDVVVLDGPDLVMYLLKK